MENEIFVLVSETEVVILSENEKREERFTSEDYFNYDEFVSAVISDFVGKMGGDVSVKLILPEVYYHYGEQVTMSVRSDNNVKYKIRNFSSPVLSVPETEATHFIEVRTDYEYEGKTYRRLEDIPLLQKYLKRKVFIYWNTDRLLSLSSFLSNQGVKIGAVVPDVCFYNSFSKDYKGGNAVVSFFDRHTVVCVFSEGQVRRLVSLPFGLSDLICRLSNAFGLSYNNSRILMSLYGFVSVPHQYVKYKISTSVYEDVKKDIDITDISYEIQVELKKQFGAIIDEIKRYSVDNIIIKGMPVVDANVLFQMMAKRESSLFDDFSFSGFCAMFETLKANSYSETLEFVPPVKQEEIIKAAEDYGDTESQDFEAGYTKPAWLNNLFDKINKSKEKITALMAE